jgi:phosphoribosylglycinamide formyltransferase 1
MSNKTRLGILVSGRGSNLQAILDAIAKGELPAEVAVVISDRENAYALERARRLNIPAVHISAGGFRERRDEYDALLVRELKERGVELVCLAGFMRIITPTLLMAFPNRVMNIHPALLPAFPGLHVQKAALEHGVRFSGCTVHFVDEGMDTGPIVIQAVVPVLEGDTEDSLSERILKQEHKIYSRAIRMYAEGRLRISGRRVVVSDGGPGKDEFSINP